MTAKIRRDIDEYQRLNSLVDLDSMRFDRVMALIVGFLSDELSANYKSRIDADVFEKLRSCLDVARRVAAGSLPSSALVESRVILWNIHQHHANDSDARKLARAAVCGLYDEDSAEYATYGSGEMFGTFFSTLLDLNPDCCRLFADYAAREIANVNPRTT